MKKIFYIISYLLIPIATANAQWEWQNPLPQGNSLYAVQYVDENLIWASGTSGTLLMSTDSGVNWEFEMLPERIYAHDIFFINENTGWICGKSENGGPNYIFGTSNGGSNWEFQLMQVTGGTFKSIIFANESKGWAAGSFTDILYTTNAGQNWAIQASAPTDILSIFLLDSLHLWAATSSTFSPTLTTTDGGLNWLPDSTVMWARDVHFLDTLIGWAAGWSYVAKTTDGGLSWEEQYNKLQEEWDDIFILNENYGWAVSRSGLILATSNGGEEWIEQNNPAISGLSSISFKDSVNGITAGNFASLLKTTDGGYLWQNISQFITEERLYGIYFRNENIGWITGNNGTILKTTNNGNNWEHQNSGVNSLLGNIVFINDLEGWTVGDDGIILKTSNGGVNWITNSSPTSLHLNDIDFNNYPIGWIIGGDALTPGQLFKTTNGGNSWNTVISISLPAGEYDIQFTSSEIGWIMSGNPTINGLQRLYRTTDEGENWDIILSNNSDTTFQAMYFLDDSNGWLSTFPALKIFHTNDGGSIWERFEAPSVLRSIYFTDSLKGWGGATTGEIYSTTDGGRNWKAQNSPMENPIDKLFFYGDNYGWAIGYLGNIIHTSNGGVSFVDNKPVNSQPDNFILYQNYPNPFNPLTKIIFEIPKASQVKLKVYDILGRELKVLVNEYKTAGKYEIEFDGSKYVSGVYFYELTAGDFTLVKKLILLK
jgi:photosystem II stability/assembly factor-like uncharacterized protein